ncbi:heme exporter protein CcmD [Paremcibacter congregatus]|mgnify:CR=1 FL=1|uniref:Heme exporter protein D n=1 Tax=Paremcibacter congregatus TaxID=2043170 RepID=A0A2G4YQE9_9PROT|nr:heme exporter protein CcmD [Paremcibacter congregatus]PHZ84517.1 heme exporter protein CcmD [Paremcibacter congregatus]QDE28736.1 heme exporter protein CcmD [Paremcibacter congregatus]|tara:strand:- start:87 stop:245 length:159 start_codon:yes stop_codon:yes gene_type:complete
MSGNDIYLWASYASGLFVLIALAVSSWRAKKQDENTLRQLEKQIQEHSEKQV